MSYDIGVNVIEVDGSGAPSITGAATSVGGFNVLTRRGIPNQPQRVTTFAQFVERFGTYFTGGRGAYLVKGFFDNGGQVAYVNRVVDPAATPAVLTLDDVTNADTLTLQGGFRGQVDPGTWGRDLYVRIQHTSSGQTRLRETAPASTDGTVIAEPVNMSAPTSLSVEIDGSTTATVIALAPSDFPTPATTTRAQIAAAINSKTLLLVASVTGAGAIRLTSTGERARLSGGWTSLRVTAANATLGFAVMATPVFGANAPLNPGGTQLEDVGDLTQGDALRITDGVNTDFVKLLTIDPATRAVTWTPNLANAYPNPRSVTVGNAEFRLTIASGAGDVDHVVETHNDLSMEPDLPNYAPRVLNHPMTGSRYLRAIDANSAAPPGRDRPVETTAPAFVQLTGGNEGAPTANHFIGDPAAHTGFSAFDAFNIQLLCCERTDSAVAIAGLGYCETRGDAMYIAAVPEGTIEGGTAVAYGQALQGKKRYGALYGPWIIAADPVGLGDDPRITLPPVGHVMGVYARIETTRGIWKAPAGDEANLLGVLDVTTRLSARDHTNLVVDGSVNGIRAIPGSGIVIDASRTLSTDPRWRYVNVRLLFNYVKSSLRDGLRWARQEPNRDTLWNAVKFGSVTPFLMGLWRQGAFGTGTPEETFTVIVDASNNPPADVEQGRLTIEVYFYPSRPAETIVIIVGQQPSGGTASEA